MFHSSFRRTILEKGSPGNVTSSSPITVRELCEKLNTVPPAGLEDRELRGMATLDRAMAEDVSFVQKEKFAGRAAKSQAGLLLVPKDLEVDHPAILPVPHVMSAVVDVLNYFHPDPPAEDSVHPTAQVSDSAVIGENVYIGPGVVIGAKTRIGSGSRVEALSYLGADVELGEGCRIFPRVTLLDSTILGHRVRIHSGSVIGADGFRYELIEGKLRKIPQVGRVVLEDDVEIGSNTTIDRAFLQETRIGARTKIDNLVQIGHNVTIGSDCILVAQIGIAGSVQIGSGVMIGGKVGIKDHVRIGNMVRIGGSSDVQNDVPDGAKVIGSPAVPVKTYARFIRFFKNFDQFWVKTISQKEKDE